MSSPLRRVYLQCGGKCYWCGRECMQRGHAEPKLVRTGWPGKLPDDYPTIEHIIPLSRGGGNKQANQTIACSRCNNKRGNSMDWIPFEKWSKGEPLINKHQINLMRCYAEEKVVDARVVVKKIVPVKVPPKLRRINPFPL